jgi:DNA-directed RNA polymerase specialized sigma24 family protein
MTAASQEAERLTQLAAAIDALPMKLRAVWLLGTVDRLDYGRIGFRLGLSVAEVERCTAQALLRIERRLSGRREWLGQWR